ncbi:MAG: hypothetical protein V7K88_32045 [Nostoc sp.]|uniref:hypothetical protein n=1 Tax=Nostoc sp. TaxID=1180 RepID=UPI002FF45A73
MLTIDSQQTSRLCKKYVFYLTKNEKAILVYYTSALSAQQISPSLQVVELPDSLKV